MKSITLFILLLLGNLLSAQNLLCNGGFEDINTCTELGTDCAPEAWLRNPPKRSIAKSKGYSKVRKGLAAENIVVGNTIKPIKNRTFMYSMLKCELIQGEDYEISIWINPLKNKIVEMGVLLSNFELVAGVKNPLSYKPSFVFQSKDITYTEGQWSKYNYSYTARGKEQFITIGNFDKGKYSPERKVSADNMSGDIIFFIDDISIRAVQKSGVQDCDSTEIRKLLYEFDYRHSYRKGLFYKEESPAPQTPQIDTIEIPDIAFSFDSYKLNENYLTNLDSISQYLSTLKVKSIEISGHSDDICNSDYNQKLSFNRAKEVKNHLLSRNHKLESIISTRGLGESQPRIENNSTANRKLNRRVEIKVTFTIKKTSKKINS